MQLQEDKKKMDDNNVSQLFFGFLKHFQISFFFPCISGHGKCIMVIVKITFYIKSNFYFY